VRIYSLSLISSKLMSSGLSLSACFGPKRVVLLILTSSLKMVVHKAWNAKSAFQSEHSAYLLNTVFTLSHICRHSKWIHALQKSHCTAGLSIYSKHFCTSKTTTPWEVIMVNGLFSLLHSLFNITIGPLLILIEFFCQNVPGNIKNSTKNKILL